MTIWRTAHFVQRTIMAHAVADDPAEKDLFRKALNLEAGWGLGRNPLIMIQMTTADDDGSGGGSDNGGCFLSIH